MYKLQLIERSILSENVLKVLTQNRIITILDFLNAEVDKLCVITKLNLPQILAIRNQILETYSAPTIDGLTLLKKYLNRPNFLPTGLESLDTILDGGLPVGFISEFCGLTGTGKTQLCHQIAINCVRNTDNTVLYIDTKRDFSALRIQRILNSYKLSHKEMAEIMFKIKVVHIWNMEDLVELLKNIKSKTINFNKLCLIIVDSLPSLMFQHLGESKIGLSFLNTFVNYCKYLCCQLQICIVCINIYTRWLNHDVDLEDDKEECQTKNQESVQVEKQNRCLGKYWQFIPTIMVLMEKTQYVNGNSDNSSQINVVVVNSMNNVSKQCILNLSAKGVSVAN